MTDQDKDLLIQELQSIRGRQGARIEEAERIINVLSDDVETQYQGKKLALMLFAVSLLINILLLVL